MNLAKKLWKKVRIKDNLLISTIDSGIAMYEVLSIETCNKSSSIYLLSSLSDHRQVKYIGIHEEKVYFNSINN